MRRKNAQETPLYVRLPSTASDKLDRAAAALGVPKKDLVAGLVTKYVDPDSQQALSALGTLAAHRPLYLGGAANPTMGTYSFQPYDPPEIMTPEQAAQFLQLEERNLLELAEAGKIPGKRLGPTWRFSREALVQWLSTPDKR